jgi:hypothetical protein
MNAFQIIRKFFVSFLTVIMILSWIVLPPYASALLALPDIGINYETMKVTKAEKLKAAGMKNVGNGDRITITVSNEKKLIFKNMRTNEELSYPPERPPGKSR